MNTNTVLSNDIINAVKLFAEFGSRNEYIRKGRTIIVNDVTDPKGEGVFYSGAAVPLASARRGLGGPRFRRPARSKQSSNQSHPQPQSQTQQSA